jgi:hypothetical protein
MPYILPPEADCPGGVTVSWYAQIYTERMDAIARNNNEAGMEFQRLLGYLKERFPSYAERNGKIVDFVISLVDDITGDQTKAQVQNPPTETKG